MIYEFGTFRLDTQLLELRGPDGPISLEPKCLALLILLVQERARAVPKDEILQSIWPDVFVTDASLSTAMRQVRQATGDTGDRQSVIKTVRGYGFRFVADVREHRDIRGQVLEAGGSIETGGKTAKSGKPTIAIRQFQLFGIDPAHQAIAEAIPAELIATLSRLRWVNVIARGSSFRFDATNSDLTLMGHDLGAQFVVSGMVEWHGARLVIFVELSDIRTGQVIWTDKVDGPLDQIYEIRARIARDLVIALELRLPMHEADRLADEPTESLDAWGHYHLGVRHMYRYNRVDNGLAAKHFRQALALDPEFARAFGGLSYTEFQNAFQHFGTDVAHHSNLALAHAEEAMKLDPLDPFCNLIYGRAKWLQGDAEDGLVWVDRAIDLNPNYAFGYYNNATLNTVLCRGDVADKNVETALGLSPLDPHLQSMFGTRALAAFISDDLDAATSYANRAMNAANPHLYVFIIAAVIHAETGDQDKVMRCVQGIKEKNVPFGKTEFLTHFNLRSPERLNSLVTTLDRLNL